ncbi:homocysteine S-methyltransferase family protein [Massiliimalia massiliensis]|uniref:homocysteine S-methyltransferase family protein n=1 Tax=Massiliimalia massiliensis TaxID=1852384 RepID=UPI00098660A2|nr:homocysteine S-methyltransferase family protein [Massiliimalia massiliensis]
MDVDLSVPLLLDGATATNLCSSQIPETLCVPKWLAEHPDQVIALQREFISAGSNVLYAPTFGANAGSLSSYGLEHETEVLNRRLVRLCKEAAGEKALVAGVLSPTGLELEPFGEASYTEVMDLFREQASILIEEGVDLLVVETMVSIPEARAAAIALRKFGKPIIITMTVDEEGNTLDGGKAVNALIILQELGISAFGLNCSCGPAAMADVFRQMREYAKVPLVAKPAAVSFEEETGSLLPISPEEMAEQMKVLIQTGASLVGGCCGTTPEHLKRIGELLHICPPAVIFDADRAIEKEDELILADSKEHYHLYCDQIECSEPLYCSPDMCDDFLRLEEERIDVIVVEIETVEEARDFSQNAHFSTLPVSLLSHNEIALRLALLLYTGKALVDSRSSIEEETLSHIAQKYGAIIY